MEFNLRIHIGIVCDQFGNFDRGGAEVQIDNTVNALNKIQGITTEIITSATNDINKFDIVHFFKSSIAYYTFACLLRKRNIPYVISTIIFPENYIFDLVRYRITHHTPILKRYAWTQFQYFIWQNAAMLFPNTDKELKFLRDIGVETPAKTIPNGLNIDEMEELADEELFYEHYPSLRGEKFVLNVARIEPRKNQARLTQACKELDLTLVLIGNNLHKEEYAKVQEINYSKLNYLGPIFNKKLLFGAIKACSVFCLPSTMETPGIAAMEAAYFNKPVVITKYGGTQYYFSDKVYYVDWRSVTEIKNGITSMMNNKVIETKEMMKKFSWDNIAIKYVKEYMHIINSK